ncbi:hypothetical protein TNCT_388391 [Trichonephila clavata]|uniref:Uncharacterized protein n=1 Tax=Trichonephila clavata TaxID=2740835 RepID=A0A8X6KI67_TRICU|nr:hypothetical protein TNCT_388391 [Trichonephila clavata]
MKFILILLFAVLAVVSAQQRVRVVRPRLPSYRGDHFGDNDDQYFASLGGADVGEYHRRQLSRRGYRRYGYGGPYGYGDLQETEVAGTSLGKAKVGLYSKEHDGTYHG